MAIHLEDPAAVAAGFATSSGGLVMRAERLCPHGFNPNNACLCFLNRERDPGLEGCVGRQFDESLPDRELIPITAAL